MNKKIYIAGLMALITMVAHLAAQSDTPQAKGALHVAVPKPGVPGVQFPFSYIMPDGQYAIGGGPDWLAVGEDMVWTNARSENFVARMDPTSNDVVARVPVGAPCSGLVIGAGSLWAPSCSEKVIYRIDLDTNKTVAKIPVAVAAADGEGGIAFGAGSVWVPSDATGSVVKRIDPKTNTVVAEIPVPPGSFTAIYGFGVVWVSSTEKSVVTVIHPTTNKVIAEIPVDKSPRFMAVGEGFVWTLNQARGTVSKIDPYQKKSVATIEAGIPGGGGEIAAGEGSVWATAQGVPITRINPVTEKVVQQFTGPGGDAIEVGLGSIWLSNGHNTLPVDTKLPYKHVSNWKSVWRFRPQKLDGAVASWDGRGKKVDVTGDGKPDLLVEEVMLRWFGEPTMVRAKLLNPALGQDLTMKVRVDGQESRVKLVQTGDEWQALLTGENRKFSTIRYAVCVGDSDECTPEDAACSPSTPLSFSKLHAQFVPDDFLLPVVPKVDNYVWILHDQAVEPQDFAALYDRTPPPNPANFKESDDLGCLRRHEWEYHHNTSFSFGIFTADTGAEVGFVYINPSQRQGYDAQVRYEVTNRGKAEGLEDKLGTAVRAWIATEWPFQNVAYPGRDIATETWNALPAAQ
jgi:virginiamycin B lyase